MAVWLEPQPVDVPPALQEAVGGHPLVAQTLARRGLLTPEAARAFLDPAVYVPALPTDLPDLRLAAERLRRAVQDKERIAVWGDLDVDGQTATALLVQVLRSLGADVTFHVPSRQDGHGVHKPGIDRLISDGVRLILTCDTGVTAHAAVAHANARGVEVIVTDHHVPGDSERGRGLPPALAVINPHRLPPGHPLSTLPGVGVAYELARTLDPDEADCALDLVALGTVADVATLTGDARYLVQRGLEALRCTSRPGLRAVYEAAELAPEGLSEEHISFVLAPRLNALGRLADAANGVELLLTGDPVRARILATEVEGLNARRQWLTKQVADAALAQIERAPSLLSDYHALVLSHPTWPSGIVGIVAGRLAERFGKPAVLISAPEGELGRGSGRSVPGVDLIASLTDCANLLRNYGGHAGAAGFSIEAERIPELRAALSRAVAARATIVQPTLAIDAYVDLADLTLDLVAQIGRLAPFGPGNPPLVLAVRDLRAISDVTIGRTEEHRRITVEDTNDRTQTVFWWQSADWPLPQGRFDLAVTLRASDYRGAPEVQVEWLDARERESTAVEVLAAPAIQIRDYRAIDDPEAVLRSLAAQADVQVWAEVDLPAGVEAHNRHQLIPGRRLAIWTLPSGPRELQAALARVGAEELILFGRDPGMDEASAFLRRLAGLVKFALKVRGGELDLEAAAAATAQQVGAVQAGLDLLEAQGQVVIVGQDNARCWLARGMGQADRQGAQGVDSVRARLDALLAETGAYRGYILRVPVEAVVHFWK
ncbi:MAG: single-stranded-DNA-specific exonuclease RecJ [Anaerolineae bacterium]|nr:single-stranded-DNA-specific exonuclease RecJ [Anaerolineae bacterium]